MRISGLLYSSVIVQLPDACIRHSNTQRSRHRAQKRDCKTTQRLIHLDRQTSSTVPENLKRRAHTAMLASKSSRNTTGVTLADRNSAMAPCFTPSAHNQQHPFRNLHPPATRPREGKLRTQQRRLGPPTVLAPCTSPRQKMPCRCSQSDTHSLCRRIQMQRMVPCIPMPKRPPARIACRHCARSSASSSARASRRACTAQPTAEHGVVQQQGKGQRACPLQTSRGCAHTLLGSTRLDQPSSSPGRRGLRGAHAPAAQQRRDCRPPAALRQPPAGCPGFPLSSHAAPGAPPLAALCLLCRRCWRPRVRVACGISAPLSCQGPALPAAAQGSNCVQTMAQAGASWLAPQQYPCDCGEWRRAGCLQARLMAFRSCVLCCGSRR